jgi:hypothetical protein
VYVSPKTQVIREEYLLGLGANPTAPWTIPSSWQDAEQRDEIENNT